MFSSPKSASIQLKAAEAHIDLQAKAHEVVCELAHELPVHELEALCNGCKIMQYNHCVH